MDLRVAVGQKEQLLKEVQKEREVWRLRDGALAATLQEKDSLLQNLKEQLEIHQKRAETPSDSVQLSGLLKDQEGDGAILCQEVAKLTSALQEYQDLVQNQQESHSQTVSSLTDQLRDVRQELRQTEKEKKEAERTRRRDVEDRDREDRRLRDSLDKRDKLVEQILQDAEEWDHLFRELQQNLQNKREPMTAVKHTL
ncbi:uncharacterized protein KZ484_026385 [Pholidichthys leucotaenia]